MSFAVVIEGMTAIAFVVVIAGGKQMRVKGWRVLAGLVALAAAVQCAGMALIVSFFVFFFGRLGGWWCRWGGRGSKVLGGVEMGLRGERGKEKLRANVDVVGLFVRQRRSVLSGLETRYFVDYVYGQLECDGLLGRGHYGIGVRAEPRGWV